MKRKKGFTLLELMIVIAILGIIAAFVVPFIAGIKEQVEIKVDTVIEQVQPDENKLEKLL